MNKCNTILVCVRVLDELQLHQLKVHNLKCTLHFIVCYNLNLIKSIVLGYITKHALVFGEDSFSGWDKTERAYKIQHISAQITEAKSPQGSNKNLCLEL